MDIKPVRRYKAPGYPDKRIVLDHPDLLKTLPQRWKNNTRAVTALSALIAMTTAACAPMPDGGTGGVGTNSGTGAGSAKPDGNGNARRTEWVAPVFEHGDGRGSFGCVSVAPPAFLSEEEALDVVRGEAEKMGLNLAADGLTLEKVNIPETKYYLNDGSKVDSFQTKDLVLDGYDSENKVGFEFVSQKDYEEWQTEENVRSSVDDYDFLSAAKILRDGLKEKTGGAAVGVFYNPMPDLDKEQILDEDTGWEEKEAMRKEQAAVLLKQQVVDFLEWLKGEGII